MAKVKIFRFRMSEQDRRDLEVAAQIYEISSSEFARVAVNNRVKKAISKGKNNAK